MNIFAGMWSRFSRRPWLVRRAVADAVVLTTILALVFALLDYFGLLENEHGGFHVLAPLISHEKLSQLGSLMLVLSSFGMIFIARRFVDIRNQLRQQNLRDARAKAESRRDPLTGLANRRHFNETLIEEIRAADENNAKFALLLMDLDRFKPINDVFGHEAGDVVLKQVAERISKASTDAVCIARTGGDEFAILVSHKTGHTDFGHIAEKILRHFEPVFEIDDKAVRIGASMGIAFYPSAGDDAEALFRHADVALYNAKRNGRNRYCLYAEEMDSAVRNMSELAPDIKRGLRESEFVPYFQPLVDLRSGRAVGMEVLARWQHPVHGLVGPDRFIPVAEALDMVGEVTFQVMRKACSAAVNWKPPLFLAVNISPGQLRDQWLAERILAVLTETGFAPSRLEVEITENSLVEDIDVARAILYSLKNQGMRIALDDFGTGYSSLSYLARFAFQKIKIDRSFVCGVSATRESMAVIKAIVSLGHALDVTVIAEGVETEEQMRALRAAGCSRVQGYLYGKPAKDILDPWAATVAIARGERRISGAA